MPFVGAVASSLREFRDTYEVLTVGVLITIFTWVFVYSTIKHIITPAILSEIPGLSKIKDVDLKNGEVMEVGKWTSVTIVYVVVLLLIFVIGTIARKITQHYQQHK